MSVFYLKVLVTPLLMLGISLASRRWGAKVGGLLSGLPVTSALVMLFLSLEQGAAFATQAVPGALAGLAAVQASYLCYFHVTRKVPALAGSVAALTSYTVIAWAISRLGSLSLSVLSTVVILSLIIFTTSKESQIPASGLGKTLRPVPRWIIPMRMLTATLLLLAITASADWLGPVASGLLAPVPVIAWPLAVFAHVQGGREELSAIVRGNAIGAIGVLGFYLTFKASIGNWGSVWAIFASVLLALVATITLARCLDKGSSRA